MKISETYKQLKKTWNEAALNGTMRDAENPLFVFSMTDTELLKKIVKGELDVTQLALIELENRNDAIRTYYTYDAKGRRIKCTIPY